MHITRVTLNNYNNCNNKSIILLLKVLSHMLLYAKLKSYKLLIVVLCIIIHDYNALQSCIV